MQNKKKNRKMERIILIVMGALIVISCFSLTAFAQYTINSKQDTPQSEARPPEDFNVKNVPANGQGESNMPIIEKVAIVELTKAQAEPFIAMAAEAFKNEGASLPESGYMCIAEYYVEEGGVSLTWLPDNWREDLTPLGNPTVYWVTFKDADPERGTGVLTDLEILNAGGYCDTDTGEGVIMYHNYDVGGNKVN